MTKRIQYAYNEGQFETLSAVVLLIGATKDPKKYPCSVPDDLQRLLNLFSWMNKADLITVDKIDGSLYFVPTQKGKDLLDNFVAKWREFVFFYDVFCYFDIATKQFLFEGYRTLSDAEWNAQKESLREDGVTPVWFDMRIAVAQMKKIDPIELIFMSYVYSKRINTEEENWELNLLDMTKWKEILDTCNTLPHWYELGDNDAEATANMEEIIRNGSALRLRLIQEDEAAARAQQQAIQAQAQQRAPSNQQQVVQTQVVEEVVEVVGVQEVTTIMATPYPSSYYERYVVDPYYVSPVFETPIIVSNSFGIVVFEW